MVELLTLICAILFLLPLFSVISAIIDENQKAGTYAALFSIIVALVIYFVIDDMTEPENYIINKMIVRSDSLNIGDSIYGFKFFKDTKVEITQFDMPYSDSYDYTLYRIYLDDKNYIDITNSKFDSLDYKLGKHNF